jgi:hypothetical protein
MAGRLPAPEWRGERAALIAECEEYNRLAESGAFDDEGDWNLWVEDHPRFAAYLKWAQTLPADEAEAAMENGDPHLINWYLDGPILAVYSIPADLLAVGERECQD